MSKSTTQEANSDTTKSSPIFFILAFVAVCIILITIYSVVLLVVKTPDNNKPPSSGKLSSNSSKNYHDYTNVEAVRTNVEGKDHVLGLLAYKEGFNLLKRMDKTLLYIYKGNVYLQSDPHYAALLTHLDIPDSNNINHSFISNLQLSPDESFIYFKVSKPEVVKRVLQTKEASSEFEDIGIVNLETKEFIRINAKAWHNVVYVGNNEFVYAGTNNIYKQNITGETKVLVENYTEIENIFEATEVILFDESSSSLIYTSLTDNGTGYDFPSSIYRLDLSQEDAQPSLLVDTVERMSFIGVANSTVFYQSNSDIFRLDLEAGRSELVSLKEDLTANQANSNVFVSRPLSNKASSRVLYELSDTSNLGHSFVVDRGINTPETYVKGITGYNIVANSNPSLWLGTGDSTGHGLYYRFLEFYDEKSEKFTPLLKADSYGNFGDFILF